MRASYVRPDWPGFGPQKNRALALATGDWVLSIDADEWVSSELADEIRVRAGTGSATAYELPRQSSFCGRFIRHGGWWPDYVARLFRRGSARFSDDVVHERLIVDGRIERLKGVLMHESIRDLEDALGKVDRYSTDGAAMLYQQGRRARLAHGHPARRVDVSANVPAARRVPRRPRRLHGGGVRRREHLLQVSQADAAATACGSTPASQAAAASAP